jgi:hypothetical protein
MKGRSWHIIGRFLAYFDETNRLQSCAREGEGIYAPCGGFYESLSEARDLTLDRQALWVGGRALKVRISHEESI